MAWVPLEHKINGSGITSLLVALGLVIIISENTIAADCLELRSYCCLQLYIVNADRILFSWILTGGFISKPTKWNRETNQSLILLERNSKLLNIIYIWCLFYSFSCFGTSNVIGNHNHKHKHDREACVFQERKQSCTGVGKSRFTVVSTRNTEFILVLYV